MLLENFRPQSKLVTKATLINKPKFPVIDAHNHLGDPFGGVWDKKPLGELLDLLDKAGVTHYVDLDGGWGEDILHDHLKHFKEGSPERFQIFGGVDWSKWESMGDGFADWAASRLQVQKEAGAQGLKIWKPFGLFIQDPKGQLVKGHRRRWRCSCPSPSSLSLACRTKLSLPPILAVGVSAQRLRVRQL